MAAKIGGKSREYEVATYAKTAYWLAVVQSVSTHKLVTRSSFIMLPVSLAVPRFVFVFWGSGCCFLSFVRNIDDEL